MERETPPRKYLEYIDPQLGFLDEEDLEEYLDYTSPDECEEDDGTFWGHQIFPI